MKKTLFFLTITLIISLTSCEILDNLIPDVDTNFSHTFTIEITNNSGYSGNETVDLSSSDEYNDFKDNIKGFEVNKITYVITDSNVPDDIYFQGRINCSEENSGQSVTAGYISRALFKDIAELETETELVPDSEGLNVILGWLDNPGKFNYNAWYSLTNSSEQPYELPENSGYHFKIKIKFYVTVLTGL